MICGIELKKQNIQTFSIFCAQSVEAFFFAAKSNVVQLYAAILGNV